MLCSCFLGSGLGLVDSGRCAFVVFVYTVGMIRRQWVAVLVGVAAVKPAEVSILV